MLSQLGPPRESQEEKEPHISGTELLLGEEFAVAHNEIGKSRNNCISFTSPQIKKQDGAQFRKRHAASL